MQTIKNILLALLGGLIFLGAMLVGTQANAQGSYIPSQFEGLSIYFPKYTKHYESSTAFDNQKNGSEGGSRGFLATYSTKLTHYTYGKMENSYGSFSHYFLLGKTLKTFKTSQLSLHVGVADGYEASYADKGVAEVFNKYLPKVMVNNDMMPMIALVYKQKLYKGIGIQLNVSPVFVNTGIYVQL